MSGRWIDIAAIAVCGVLMAVLGAGIAWAMVLR